MVQTNDTTTYYVPMAMIAVGMMLSMASLQVWKKKTLAGFYPTVALLVVGAIRYRTKMDAVHGLYSEDGGSKLLVVFFDCLLSVLFAGWGILLFSIPQFVLQPSQSFSTNLFQGIRKKSLLLWLIPVGIFVRLDSYHALETNKLFVKLFWDPPLLAAGQIARACNHRMFGPFYSEIDDQIVVGSFPMAEDVDFMASKNVIGVINMCNEWAGPRRQYLQFGIEQIRLKTVDTMAPKVEDLENGISFINKKLANADESEKVFIHCKGGIGRAATMTLAYYISKGMSIEDGFDLLKSKRSIVNSKIKEYPAILELEKKYGNLEKK